MLFFRSLCCAVLFFTVLSGFAQNQAQLVKPWRNNFFFNHTILSKNGKYALLTGSESFDQDLGHSKSMLVDLENKKVIKSIRDGQFMLKSTSDPSLLSEFDRITLSNTGRYIVAFEEYHRKVHLINLNNPADHKICNLGKDVRVEDPQFLFSGNDSLLIIYNNEDYNTYFIDTKDCRVKNQLKRDSYADKIWVENDKFYLKGEKEGEAIIQEYNLQNLKLIKEFPIPSQEDYSGMLREFFTNNFFVQYRLGEKDKKIKVSVINLSSKKQIDFEQRISKLKKKFDYFNLIDVESSPNSDDLFMVFAFYTSNGIDYQIWCFNFSENTFEKISERPIWYMQTGEMAEAKDNVIALPNNKTLFFLGHKTIVDIKKESVPFWLTIDNNETKSGYGLEKTQEITIVSQIGSKTVFGSDDWITGGDHYTEIDLKTGKIINRVYESWGPESGAYDDKILVKHFPDYAKNVREYSISEDSIQNHYYISDSSHIWASVAVRNDHQDILINTSDKAVDFFNWRKNQEERMVSLIITNKGEYIFYTPDRYYMISSDLDNALYFQKDLKTYPFEQFDLKYNRPDIILDRLGYADSSLIAAYNAAYKKRLKKMGFTEDMLKDDFHLPEIEIENFEEMPTINDEGSINLKLKMHDSKYKLDRINIWVNDVAIYGKDGISLRDKNVQDYQTDVAVFLAKGNNKVQVSVLNQVGAESYKETFEVECTVGKDQPNLYLITIGESEFQQSDFNLTYAAKDAKDVASIFSDSKVYNEVYSKTLTNEEVTKENILNLKPFLEKADINDHVMVFIAGHGVLNANLDYYFATYDMDFQHPEERGIAYEDLESLLDGIKPLKKTLMIDACHSGEIDKEEVELAQAETSESGDIQFRAVGNTAKPKLGSQNTYELTKSLFTDLRKGTGATVISSAGGMEFAMEGDDWNNGLFTYCLLNGIQSKDADLNGDKEIWLSELKEYVSQQVATLSNGKQQPTSRIENQTVDFRVW